MAGRQAQNQTVATSQDDPVSVVPAPLVLTFKDVGVEGEPDTVVTWEVLPPADVAYYYLPEENPTGASYPGVPLGNLTQEVFDAQPKWIQNSIKHSPMYSKEPPEAPASGKGKNKDAGDGGND